MEINEDVVITGKLTVVGALTATSLLAEQDVVAGRDYRFDGQSGKLIDNDSNAHLTGITCSTIQANEDSPSIPNATSEADAVVKLNLLLTKLRSAGFLATP